MLHCHKLRHEDQGAMAVVEALGGCDYDFTDYISDNQDPDTAYQSCQYYSQIYPICQAIESSTISTTTTTETTTSSIASTTTTMTNNRYPTTTPTKNPSVSPTSTTSCCIYDGDSPRRDARCGMQTTQNECQTVYLAVAQDYCNWTC